MTADDAGVECRRVDEEINSCGNFIVVERILTNRETSAKSDRYTAQRKEQINHYSVR